MNRIFIIAGEVSGDTHAAGLLRELKALEPDMKVIGLGGPKMRELIGEGIEDWVETAGVVGLWEVVKMYRYFKEKMDAVLDAILDQKPEAVILVDYPGFNLRLAKALRTAGYKGRIFYYISPQVWAWKKGRVKTMAQVLDLMICIFPFEKEFYEKSGLRTEFSGHPMVDRLVTLKRDWKRESGLVGWFPGSRLNEVRRLFPLMMDAAKAIKQAIPNARFAVSAANESLAGYMRTMAEEHGMPEAKRWIETGTVYDLMQRAEAGAVASGTATLEAACFGLPYTLVYNVSWPTYIIGKLVVRIKHLGIVNILAKREVVTELVQEKLTADSLAKVTLDLLTHESKRQQMQKELAEVVATLGSGGAYSRAAQTVHEAL
ncbi:lipid-A-disaccharide synthase [Prosthecobacter sp.]|uniref:lipid-A-disaccharide synthase n=1 Tax=Prosthecobacter sp. TaxID=1965333 RepID=UPI001D8D5D54|nr:lipid-A-disaccharide synthase [Prosthecobacter sp.]MCB1278281.1 lipid-A-disaccharide synthase [Prosthecobacter sp.]